MKRINTLALCMIFLASTTIAKGQISFVNKTSLLQSPTSYYSGIAVGVADMNGDGLDDILRLHQGNQLSIEYQTTGGLPFTHLNIGSVSNEREWSIAAGDINNDGYCDILTGGMYDGVKVLTAMNNGAAYQSATLPGPTIFIQGSNFADINNDGHIDVFACHDDAKARIWGNTGTGSFVQADTWIDLATVPVSDNSGNYGSIWSDFDNDGDLDLYIAKCRQGVDDPEDPRRINALYVNDGQNNYSEAAAKYGLKIKWQSWTADFQDIDNDGDFDCLVANHDYNLQLLENDGAGHFTDISAQAGISSYNGEFLQGIMRDFDNDGFMDIITAEPAHLLRNNGDKTFTKISGLFDGTNLGTLAAGDLNHDGFVDIYSSYACDINNPCNIPDKLWMNAGNDSTAATSHFLAVSLTGTQSNRMGIGARIEIHGSWGIQVREVRSGESYGIMNSLTQHFGLGQETEIEYLVVYWPSGVVDVIENPAADQFLTIEEQSTCNMGTFELELSGLATLCPGESLTITAPEGYTYLWSNGAVSQSLTVNEAGNYRVVLVDDTGCALSSNVVKVVTDFDETPHITIAGDTTFCQGNSVVLTSSSAAAYLWSNGSTTQSITIEQTGNYQVNIEGICDNFDSETIHVEVLAAPAPQADGLVILKPEPVTLIATGITPHWYDSPNATIPIAIGDTLLTDTIKETTTFFVDDVHSYGGGIFQGGMIQHQGSLFSGATANGQIIFDVIKAFTLKQVTVLTDMAGERKIELRNSSNEVLLSKSIDIPAGETVLDLDFFIEPGTQYNLSTDSTVNKQVLGTISPRLRRSNQGVVYPYETTGIMTITGSNLGVSFYYYFFNWQIEVASKECISDRIPVVVTLEPSAVAEPAPFGKMAVHPNPSSGLFNLDLQALESGEASLSVTDLTGRKVLVEKFELVKNVQQLRQLDLSGAPAGVYFLQMRSGERAGRMKLVVE